MKKIIDWFNDNYLEGKDTIAFLVEKYTLTTQLSVLDIFNFCQEVKKHDTRKILLYTHIELLLKMNNAGIQASRAGEILCQGFKNTQKFDFNQ